VNDTSRQGGPGAGAAVEVEPPVMLIRYRDGVIGQTARTVHLVPMSEQREASAFGAWCGALLRWDAIETVPVGQGFPCIPCVVNQAIVTTTAAGPAVGCTASADPNSPGPGLLNEPLYQAWGWPVTQHPGKVRLSLHPDASATAIPITLGTQVTEVLTARHCAPAVLVHPDAPEHLIVLTGEPFSVALPWPPGVYQITGTLMLPPTTTPRGPVTWVVPPCRDSMRLTREIDVFGALRTVLSAP